jgi:PIN like domain
LFDGFDGYRSPTEADYEGLFRTGLVVPDANVLLNLYRYNSETRDDFFNVLERLEDRLWVPHHVLVEFWRNRESALRDPTEGALRAVDALEDLHRKAVNELRTWVNRVALPAERFKELEQSLNQVFGQLSEAIKQMVGKESEADAALETGNDEVLKRLEKLLKGRVGKPMTSEEHTAGVAEGKRRVAAGIPPGYLDADKAKRDGDERSAGDYLVWEQVLREAEVRKCNVLLVTGDVKEDWWRKERGQARGPRLELVDEMQAKCGSLLFMLRPESLLLHAKKLLAVEVREGSLREVERVDRSTSDSQTGGWTTETLSKLMDRLWDEGGVQWMAICWACAKGDGFVSRSDVYDLGDYDESRTLRGFTRPTNRLAQEFRDSGIIPTSAVDILQAVYDPTISSVQASGFRVPQSLIPLVQGFMTINEVTAEDYEPKARSIQAPAPVPTAASAAQGASRIVRPSH